MDRIVDDQLLPRGGSGVYLSNLAQQGIYLLSLLFKGQQREAIRATAETICHPDVTLGSLYSFLFSKSVNQPRVATELIDGNWLFFFLSGGKFPGKRGKWFLSVTYTFQLRPAKRCLYLCVNLLLVHLPF